MTVTAEKIVEYLRAESGRPLTAEELARELAIDAESFLPFGELLAELASQGVLYRGKANRYAAPSRINLVVGTLTVIKSGAGFVVPDARDGDLYIPQEELRTAVDGDRVIARLERKNRGGKSQGSIVRILRRARESVVGVYHPAKNFGFVVPEPSLRLSSDVFVPPGEDGGATEGDVVVVRITSWGEKHRGPVGEVDKVLGKHGAPGVDILAVLYGHELPVEFPEHVLEEAEALRKRGITEADLAGRVDLRDELIFTIDPVDAKDHDDALSIKAVDDGYEVGIHIADVSFYVTEGSALDLEALRRGTSVYMVDRTIPMLPEALSADLCSLKNGVDRLAMSVIARLDAEGNVFAHKLVRSVIRSRHKLAYERAQEVIEGKGSIDAETDAAILLLVELSRKLREKRVARGSLDFDLPEARVILNTAGEPTDIQKIVRLESHRLIEDFMLLANEIVARKGSRQELPFLYRVHESPDEDRIAQLQEFAKTFGYSITKGRKPSPKDLQRLLERIRGRPEERLLSTVVLRSMRQARYSHENLGHFGLAAKHYAHFTSPIRRYPDLIVHRICAHAFLNDENVRAAINVTLLPEVARISSERERVAVDAERDSIELKKVEFMERHLGDEFKGTISGVAAFGFFVLLDDFYVEGMVHVSSLEDDYYQFREERYEIVGEHSGRRFRLGDRVRVQVARVNRDERKIDFVIIEDATARGTRGRQRGAPKRPGKGPRRGPKKGGKGRKSRTAA
ncbi:MAG: ribonuclease R [Gemmatimonadota bacterium]